MLVNDFETIPDLYFKHDFIACDPSMIAARLLFRCAPRAGFLGLEVNGRTVTFAEHVFYELKDTKIWRVWSVLDKSAIEGQLSEAPP